MSDILVVKTAGLAPWIENRYGLITGCGEEILGFVEREHEFLPRPDMETDPSYRQIIPYVAVTRGGEVYATRRLNKGGEARLHGKLSLGVGGHIERVDDDRREGILMRALEREVAEEVGVEQIVSLTPLGVINEEGDEVSRVHLGFLFRMEVTGEVAVRETDKLEGMWLKISELPQYASEMEGWSRIAMEALLSRGGVFTPADILLPREGVDMTKWSCIACDQFTSEPEYWAEADRIVGTAPSTLRLMLPEAYLGRIDEQAAQSEIYRAMESYVNQGLFRTLENSYIYVERTLPTGKVRRGLAGKLDLECYDWGEGTSTPVRATEGTIESRLPARMAVRAGASLEMPHIMVFINDPGNTLIPSAAGGEELYDFELMLGGGHIRAERVCGEAAERVLSQLDALPGEIKFAMGDGNHSLAAAKRCWEQIKPTLSEAERETHPARYALAEIVNMYDPALDFKPIHRLVTGAAADRLPEAFAAGCPEGAVSVVRVVTGSQVRHLGTSLGLGELVAYTDKLIGELIAQYGGEVDYVHGDAECAALVRERGGAAVMLPALEKDELFPYIAEHGPYPKKSFSIGEAREKRYYLECRKIK